MKIGDPRLAIHGLSVAERRFGLAIGDPIGDSPLIIRHHLFANDSRHSPMRIANRQSKSSIASRQSVNRQSAAGNRQ